jgi:hypothetical protein
MARNFSGITSKLLPLAVAFGCAGLGMLSMSLIGAATYAADAEPEDGQVKVPAAAINDPLASGGSVVRFQAAATPPPPSPPTGGTKYSLRFFGTQTNDVDRVKVPLTPNKSIDVSGSFTLEWWMKTASGNDSGSCVVGNMSVGDYDWISGNIIMDRDIDSVADFGKYGVSLIANEGGRISYGVDVGGSKANICSSATVMDGQWHHVAVTRNSSSGQICIFIDGSGSGCKNGPTGNISYNDARSGGRTNSDPYLVMGAEKHDYASPGTGYHGWLDEVRLSNSVRYSGSFSRPSAPFSTDANTVALYHMDSGSGTTATDATGDNPGTLRVGGSSSGPQWSTDTPFTN